MCPIKPMLTVSVVSHNQGHLIGPLLAQLDEDACQFSMHVVVTENVREAQLPDFKPKNFELTVLRNDVEKGFGANHNAAFTVCNDGYFAVLNPDLRLGPGSLRGLVEQVRLLPGIAGPRVLDINGNIEDSARRMPDIIRLWRRVVLGERRPDYDARIPVQFVDWLAGMCLMFDRTSFSNVGGFDERYHLYCEDVDICLRMHLSGRSVSWVQTATVVHDAQRDSRRKFRFLRWHVESMLRLLTSTTYWRFRRHSLK